MDCFFFEGLDITLIRKEGNVPMSNPKLTYKFTNK